ncbi:MAG: hypothetical protein ABIR19_00100 [Ginsengibacter sp.]
MKLYYAVVFCLFCSVQAFPQDSKINKQQFFLDEHPIEVTLSTDIKMLRNSKKNAASQPGKITLNFSDTLSITDTISVQVRGVYRKENCDLASLMLNFANNKSNDLANLKKIKLVGNCRNGKDYDELLLKEFLVYKMYNFITNMSFRVRLVHITYNDSKEKVKPFSYYGFLIEDMNDLAERNNCIEVKKQDFLTEATDRQQMTIINLFQFMIGNTDWSIPHYHNMKLMVGKNSPANKPFAIAYDFDYSGFVNAHYAVPSEGLGIESVRQRLYRGFPRGYDELTATIAIFNEKKESIYYYLKNFELIDEKEKKSMISYLDDFYETINNRKEVESIFIRNARSQ